MSPPMESTERASTFISEGDLAQLEGHSSGDGHLKHQDSALLALPGDQGACCESASIICE